MILDATLKKYARTPGHCNLEELDEVKKFFNEYKDYRDAHKNAFVTEPTGQTLETLIDGVDWYKDYIPKNKFIK